MAPFFVPGSKTHRIRIRIRIRVCMYPSGVSSFPPNSTDARRGVCGSNSALWLPKSHQQPKNNSIILPKNMLFVEIFVKYFLIIIICLPLSTVLGFLLRIESENCISAPMVGDGHITDTPFVFVSASFRWRRTPLFRNPLCPALPYGRNGKSIIFNEHFAFRASRASRAS